MSYLSCIIVRKKDDHFSTPLYKLRQKWLFVLMLWFRAFLEKGLGLSGSNIKPRDVN